MSLPYSSSSPADSKEKKDECIAAGAAMFKLLEMDLKPRDIMTKGAFENAIRMVMVTGGSTNAVLHLIAMSRSTRNPETYLLVGESMGRAMVRMLGGKAAEIPKTDREARLAAEIAAEAAKPVPSEAQIAASNAGDCPACEGHEVFSGLGCMILVAGIRPGVADLKR